MLLDPPFKLFLSQQPSLLHVPSKACLMAYWNNAWLSVSETRASRSVGHDPRPTENLVLLSVMSIELLWLYRKTWNNNGYRSEKEAIHIIPGEMGKSPISYPGHNGNTNHARIDSGALFIPRLDHDAGWEVIFNRLLEKMWWWRSEPWHQRDGHHGKQPTNAFL